MSLQRSMRSAKATRRLLSISRLDPSPSRRLQVLRAGGAAAPWLRNAVLLPASADQLAILGRQARRFRSQSKAIAKQLQICKFQSAEEGILGNVSVLRIETGETAHPIPGGVPIDIAAEEFHQRGVLTGDGVAALRECDDRVGYGKNESGRRESGRGIGRAVKDGPPAGGRAIQCKRAIADGRAGDAYDRSTLHCGPIFRENRSGNLRGASGRENCAAKSGLVSKEPAVHDGETERWVHVGDGTALSVGEIADEVAAVDDDAPASRAPGRIGEQGVNGASDVALVVQELAIRQSQRTIRLNCASESGESFANRDALDQRTDVVAGND